MQAHWRRHLFVLAFTAGTWILAWILDYSLLGPRGEGWVPINFRGFIAGPYMAATLVFAAATTTLVAVLRPAQMLAVSIYLATLVGVLVLSALSFWIWQGSGEGNLEDADTRMSNEAQSLSRAIELQEWQPMAGSVDIVLEVLKVVASVKIKVQAMDAEGLVAVVGTTNAGRLERGRTTVSVPVQRFGASGSGQLWRIRLLLNHEGAIADVEFAMNPVESDGALIGRRLPPPRSD